MSKVLNLPNQITVARLGLAIVYFVLLSQYTQREPNALLLDVAAALFIVAAATDFLDGYLARKYGQITAFGRVLDPLVDKVLICGAFILFVAPPFTNASGQSVTGVRGWMVVVIVGRELLVTGLRGFNESMGLSFGASLHGKLKMWMQSIAAPTILLLVAHEDQIGGSLDTVKSAIMWVTVIVTALSMVGYLVRSRYLLEETDTS